MEIKTHTPYMPNFTARNPKIRFADDIARHVNKSFPRISSTLIETQKNVKRGKFYGLILSVSDKIRSVRKEKRERIIKANKLSDFIKAFIVPVRKYNTANCGESAELAAIVAQVNGLKNVTKACLTTSRGKDMDHAVLMVNDEKMPYIIDAWLGFADTIPNTIQRYKNEFRHCFDGRMIKSKKLKFIKSDYDFDFVINRNLTNSELQYLKKYHKDLILPKK